MQTKNDKLAEYFNKGKAEKFPKGETIPFQKNREKQLYLINKGFVGIFSTKKSGGKLIAFYGKGDIFPLVLAFSKSRNKFDCVALSQVETAAVSLASIGEQVQKGGETANGLIERLGVVAVYYMDLVTNMTSSAVKRRLIERLLYYAHHFGTRRNGATMLRLPLTQMQWGESLSMTRETVARTFGLLRRKKLIDYRKKAIMILDKDGLEKEMEA